MLNASLLTLKWNFTQFQGTQSVSSLQMATIQLCDLGEEIAVFLIYGASDPVIKPESLSSPAAAKLLQWCPTLCDPRDGSPPGSIVPGILQARTLEWVAISFSNAGK